jgi:hypothetical protein
VREQLRLLLGPIVLRGDSPGELDRVDGLVGMLAAGEDRFDSADVIPSLSDADSAGIPEAANM